MYTSQQKSLYRQKFSKKIIGFVSAVAGIFILLMPALATASSPSTQFVDPNPTTNDGFGYALSISSDGNVAVVGSPESPGGGTAYVFVNNSGTWTEAAQFTPSDLTSNSYFGNSVAITPGGTEVIIGANGSGKAYIFSASSEAWTDANETTPVAELTEAPGQVQEGDNFGWSVAISGDGNTALVGANLASQDGLSDVGSAYIFNQVDGNWDTSPSTELMASDGAVNSNFGYSVALSSDGSDALVGAPGIGSTTLVGSAYQFSESSSGWTASSTMTQTQELSSSTGINGAPGDGAPEDLFGVSVGLSGNGTVAIVGAQNHAVNGNEVAGAAYIYTSGSNGLSMTYESVDPIGQFDDKYGASVAIAADGSSVLVGSPGYNNDEGQAYSYTPDNNGTGEWTNNDTFAPTANSADQKFGFSVAVIDGGGSESDAFIGAPGSFSEADSNTQAVPAKKGSGNNDEGTAYLFASPTLNKFSPQTVGEGSDVTIKGVGLLGASVSWNGQTLSIVKDSNKSITVNIPLSSPAGTAPLAVENTNGTTLTSGSLTVAGPVIKSVPKTVSQGQTITIKGQYLAGVTSVNIGDTSIAPASTTDKTITVVIPSNATPGLTSINVVAPSGTSNSVSTTVEN